MRDAGMNHGNRGSPQGLCPLWLLAKACRGTQTLHARISLFFLENLPQEAPFTSDGDCTIHNASCTQFIVEPPPQRPDASATPVTTSAPVHQRHEFCTSHTLSCPLLFFLIFMKTIIFSLVRSGRILYLCDV